MKTPTEFEIQQLIHKYDPANYDPAKRREYYLRTRKLKGRKAGQGEKTSGDSRTSVAPKTGRTREAIAKSARNKQRKELAEKIKGLEERLKKLEALIKKREREEASEDRKSKAKKERAAKERDKPDTAAEKAEAARENKKYREKNQQKLKNEAKKRDSSSTSGGGSSKGEASEGDKEPSVSELKSLATKVRGQIAVAKRKLAAL